jgi:hypothetical protein
VGRFLEVDTKGSSFILLVVRIAYYGGWAVLAAGGIILYTKITSRY